MKRTAGRPKQEDGNTLKCPRCGNKWKTKSKARYASCSACHKPIYNPYYEVKN